MNNETPVTPPNKPPAAILAVPDRAAYFASLALFHDTYGRLPQVIGPLIYWTKLKPRIVMRRPDGLVFTPAFASILQRTKEETA